MARFWCHSITLKLLLARHRMQWAMTLGGLWGSHGPNQWTLWDQTAAMTCLLSWSNFSDTPPNPHRNLHRIHQRGKAKPPKIDYPKPSAEQALHGMADGGRHRVSQLLLGLLGFVAETLPWSSPVRKLLRSWDVNQKQKRRNSVSLWQLINHLSNCH